MDKAYLVALIDSLNNKIDVLNKINEKNVEQYKLIKAEPFSVEAFDKNSNEKGVLIYQLNQLDDGFKLIYDKIGDELSQNKAEYASEIRKMQEQISTITDLSTKIQADEARNKAALEAYFARERGQIKGSRSRANAAKSYAKAMQNRT